MASRADWKKNGNVETALVKSCLISKIPTFKIIGMCCTVVEQIVQWYLTP